MKPTKSIYFLFILLFVSGSAVQAQNGFAKMISKSVWDTLFPKRAGTSGTHPQGYNYDFYAYNNMEKAVDAISDYFVVIRTKAGVWGQLITVTRKSTQKSYNYSNVESWWHTNKTPENIVIVDFEKFLNESSSHNNKRELAAFLANISKETTGGWQLPVGGGSPGDYALWGLYFVHELGYTKTNSAGSYSQSHPEFPPNPKVGYYGRGPIQLSWNYNYGQFSKFIYNDKNVLLDYPDSLQENGVLSLMSAIWFWMMPQCPKPACHQVMHDMWLNDSSYSSSRMYYKGFAHTNNIINGGLECRSNSTSAFTQKVALRSDLYKHYLKKMGFNKFQINKEDSADYSTLCYKSTTDAMENYGNCKAKDGIVGSFGIDSLVKCSKHLWIDGKTYTKNTATAYHVIKKGDRRKNDSLVLLNLRIKPESKSTVVKKVCDQYTWINGITYFSSTDTPVYVMKGGSYNGCDSILKLNLTVLKTATYTQKIMACDSFKWMNGVTYYSGTDTPTYRMPGKAANGCDSLILLNLTILKKAVNKLKVAACDSFKWINGQTYTSSTDTPFVVLRNRAFNGCDSILELDLTVNKKATGIDLKQSCKAYKWINGITYTSSTDTPIFVLKNAAFHGCDSIVKLSLQITTIDKSVSQNNAQLKATPFADKYQWMECLGNLEPIAGDTLSEFEAKRNGRYAVLIQKDNCLDTSACYEVIGLKMDIYSRSNISVYPNPFDKSIWINNRGKAKVFGYRIIDLSGAVVKQNMYANSTDVIDVSALRPQSVYMMVLYVDAGVFVYKMCKE